MPMTFNLHICIDSQSPEGHSLESMVSRDHVSPEEAIRRALRHPALAKRTPAEEMFGAFSSPEDVALIDEVMEYVRELRETDRLRDFDI